MLLILKLSWSLRGGNIHFWNEPAKMHLPSQGCGVMFGVVFQAHKYIVVPFMCLCLWLHLSFSFIVSCFYLTLFLVVYIFFVFAFS